MLCSIPGSALDAMFSGRHELTKVNGRIFIDRDPIIFKLVIQYLRSNFKIPLITDKSIYKLFIQELDFWQLDPNG